MLACILIIFFLEGLKQLLDLRDTEWGLYILNVVLFQAAFPDVRSSLLRVNAILS